MPINTNLNVNPYFDDYNINNEYYRMLFKPVVAVQARELTQLQSMLQNQIEQFGNWAFQNGDIVYGCAISDIASLPYIRLSDVNSTGNSFSVNSLINTIVTSATTGLSARVVQGLPGISSNYPNTNIVYIIYNNTGTSGQQFFSNTEVLNFTNIANGSLIATVNSYVCNTTTNTIGNAHAINVEGGIAYLNGTFVKILNPTIGIVNAYGTDAGNSVVGFVLNESIVTADEDASLYDNALGYGNINAPGADRLKLSAGLLTISNASVISNNSGFNPIATYNFSSLVATTNATSDLYSIIGSAISKRIYDENGNFVVSPFSISTLSYSNSIVVTSNSLNALVAVGPGTGYAQGNNVAINKTAYVSIRRGNDTQSFDQQTISFNYGSYFLVDEVSGSFNFNGGTVTLYDTIQQSVTTREFNALNPVGNVVGTASVRCFAYVSGTISTNNATYALHVYNVKINSGFNINQVKSVFYNGTVVGVADLATPGLIGTSYDDQIYSFGIPGIKNLRDGSGTSATEFVYRAQNTATLSISSSIGTATVTLPNGNDTVNFGVGQISDAAVSGYVVINNSNNTSAALTGTVSVYTNNTYVIGSGTSFLTTFSYGAQILVGTDHRTVMSVVNSTALIVDSSFSANSTGTTYYRYYPSGEIIGLNSLAQDIPSYINVTNSTSFTINMNFNSGTQPTSGLALSVIFDVNRITATPFLKIINKNRFVKIDTTGNPNGPWSLGFSDIHQITGVYVGSSSSYSISNPNLLSQFVFDSGASDTSYGIGYLYATSPVTTGASLLVQLDYFSVNTASGSGFFSVESYPIDDTNTANTTAIQTMNIPVYVDGNGNNVYLRDYIDFRTSVLSVATDTGYCNTANASQVTTSLAGASISNTSNTLSTITYVTPIYNPSWGQKLQANYSIYLPRTDLLFISPDSSLHIKEGVSAQSPQAPLYPDNAMAVALINVSPFPSLTTDQLVLLANTNKVSKNICRNVNNFISYSSVTNRRYTMQDIGGLDKRITNLEYYTSLNLLQQNTQNITVLDSNGLNRFKNGFFSDPLNNFAYSSVSDPEFSIAIDINGNGGRPIISRNYIKTDFNSGLSSTTLTGRIVTLPYTSVRFMTQGFATDYRSASLVAFSWNGTLQLIPAFDNAIDTTVAASASISGGSSNLQEFNNNAYNSIYGDWRTTTTTTTNTQNIGTFLTAVSLKPYVEATTIAFYAYNMRPNQQLHVFFDSILVDQYCAPGQRNSSNNYVINIPNTSNNKSIIVANTWGTPIYSDQNGMVIGKFNVPKNTFITGTIILELADVNSLVLGQAAITTLSSAAFTASHLAVTKESITITTVNTVENNYYTPPITYSGGSTYNSTNEHGWPGNTTTAPGLSNDGGDTGDTGGAGDDGGGDGGDDPIAQVFGVVVPDSSAGIFVTSIDLFFNQLSLTANNGVTVYICQTLNGYPDVTNIIPFTTTHLPKSSINISANASVATTFTFESPAFLNNGLNYAFVVKPDNNDPDYQVWYANLGSIDVSTKNQFFAEPSIGGTAFYGATSAGWTALQTEYLKFNINIAQFSNSTGDAYFNNQNTDYINVYNIGYNGLNSGFLPGDYIFQSVNSTISTANLSVYATLDNYNTQNNIFTATYSTGGFVNNSFVQVHRFANGTISTVNTSTLIGYANTGKLINPVVDALVGQYSTIQPAGTSLYFDFKGTSNSYSYDTNSYPILLGTETEFHDKERIVSSYSNELNNMSGANSIQIHAAFISTSAFISPVIDTIANKQLVIQNIISNTGFNYTEYFNSGSSLTKYISEVITLAPGQEAEDLQVILSAYRPSGTDIQVYAKFLNPSDADPISKKTWTPLINGSNTLYSNPSSESNYNEYTYTVANYQPYYTPVIPAVGTITTTSACTNIIGSGTNFTSLLQVGWYITIPANSTFTEGVRQIVSITNNTFLAINSPFSGTYSANLYNIVAPTTTAWLSSNTITQVMGSATTSTTNNIITGYSTAIGANGTWVNSVGDSLMFTNANTYWNANQQVFYYVPTGSVPITGLTGNTFYYIHTANTSAVTLSSNLTSGPINISNLAATDTDTHQLQSTAFLETFVPGQIVSIGNDEQVIVSIANNTFMTVGVPWTSNNINANVYLMTNEGITYFNSSNAAFTDYTQYQLKIILTSNSSAQVPIISTVQALALQL